MLSVVLPAYNESDKIEQDVRAASAFLHNAKLEGEIIVVDDGSTDGTGEKAKSASVHENVVKRIIKCSENRGKGHALRRGFAESKGDVVMFVDTGSCFALERVLLGIEMIRSGRCQIAHASRRLAGSVIHKHPSALRRVASPMFRRLMTILMGLPRHLTDTQCGLKVYKGDIGREIYSEGFCDGYMFDIEMILRASRKGYWISEFPVECTHDSDSRMPPFKIFWDIIRDCVRLKRKL